MKNNFRTKHDFKNAATEDKITAALMKFLNSYDLNRITIAMLCEECGISRSTFYRHYQDVYAVLEKMENEVFEEYKAVLLPFKDLARQNVTESDLKRFVMRYLHTCYYHRKEIISLVRLGPYSGFHNKCLELLYEVIIVLLDDLGWVEQKHQAFAARYLALTVFSLLYTWLEQDNIDFQTFYRMYVEIYITNIEVANKMAAAINAGL